jgi:cell growth-regulating nucleolar protein
MVFFSCDGCGEMLKKNQVDAHAGRCRRCAAVSCVDCSVSFYGGKFAEEIIACIEEISV